MPAFLAGYNAVYLGHQAPKTAEITRIASFKRPHVFTWSYKAPSDLRLFCARNAIPLTYVEDGFIRSFGLGADRSAPASLVFDDLAMHFDRLQPSRLETLLASYDFDADPQLMEHAHQLRQLMVTTGLSKYNFQAPPRRLAEVAVPGKRKILVLGQVEDDLSIRYGADQPMSGNELVMLAADENPDAQIFYRPHPESLAYSKPHYSNPELVSDVCQILDQQFSIADCLDNCDKVYSVTSLAGFEAALRGKPVVTVGAPFYAGWGFTEDQLPIARRTRHLTATQVLAAAYLLYPRYSGLPADAASGDILTMLRRFASSMN